MVEITMTAGKVDLFSSFYTGARDGIFFDGEMLHVPEELEGEVRQAISESEADNGLMSEKTTRIAMLTENCRLAIVGGYQSEALGGQHIYPSGVTDQINMMGSVTASLLPGLPTDWVTPFWCQDAAGAWAFRAHGSAQIQQAGRDGKAHVVTCQSILEELSAQVAASTNVEDIRSVIWPEGTSL